MHISRLNKPVIAITMGDPTGIGPEVTLKALAKIHTSKSALFLIIGDFKFLMNLQKKLVLRLPLRRLEKDFCGWYEESGIPVIDLDNTEGVFTSPARAGRASLAYIDTFLKLFKKGYVSALVTAPVSKESIKKVLLSFQGHTEYLALKTNTRDYAMLFMGGPFSVGLVTTHIPLKEVSGAISKALIIRKVKTISNFFRSYCHIPNPYIGVAGLNPHCGEGGTMGKDEQSVIRPACEYLRRRRYRVQGPFSSETLFFDAFRNKYDILLSMYHDQALTPLKMVARDTLVNVTAGLPFVRTSPAHGTAHDIRNTFMANAKSMEYAIRRAVALSEKKRTFR